MEQDRSDEFNNWIKEVSWIQVSKEFSFNEESNNFEGEFKVPIESKKDLNFKVSISAVYPSQNINFFCLTVDGYEHQMPDGLICHNPDVFFNKKTKFFHEFEKLKFWIEKFYIEGEKSAHYEHLIFPDTLNKLMLFPSLDLKYHQSKKFGYFNYVTFNQIGNKSEITHETYLLMGIDGLGPYYSSSFRNLSKIKGHDIKQGIWFHINTPPVLYRRKTITKWSSLLELFDTGQIKHLYNFRDLVFKKRGREGKYFILISYTIPNTEKGIEEAHLELIEDHVKEEPHETKYKKLESYSKIERTDTITWGKTKNIAYENYFGRGALSKKITKNKILIIGIGAIGSCLAKVLVRGGATHLGLIDFDRVESGNICRSEYRPISIQESKTVALERELISISPYVEILKDDLIFPSKINNEAFNKRKERLQAYDIIFDCTTDKYLSNILDQMNLSARVINLSISNKVKEFVCVTRSSNITSQKTKIYEKLGKDEEQEPFYPEVGCFHPTFEASYNDINLLLNYGIKEINRRLENEVGLQSFVIENSESVDGIKVNLDYDV